MCVPNFSSSFLDDNSDLMEDLRTCNGRPDSHQFDEFWSLLAEYLRDIAGDCVGERRDKRPDMSFMPFALSAEDLVRVISAKLSEANGGADVAGLIAMGKFVPSARWVELQFMPRRPGSTGALQYTGKFNVQRKVQARQISKADVDAHYAAAGIKHQREFAIRFSSHVVYVYMDDKHKIDIGIPGLNKNTESSPEFLCT